MTQKEKQLLIKDLCARLPYGVKVIYVKLDFDIYDFNHNIKEIKTLIEEYDIKPYLRPMSSMTEEEKEEYDKTFDWDYSIQGTPFDWLNAHHFDYRGLISMGLALEAPEGMYNN